MFAETMDSAPPPLQGIELVVTQTAGNLRLEQRIGARRTTAQMPVPDRHELETRGAEQRLDDAADLQAVLQAARRMKRDAPPRVPGGPGH